MQASYQVNEHLSSKIIELISMALIGKQTDSSKDKKEKSKSKNTKGEFKIFLIPEMNYNR